VHYIKVYSSYFITVFITVIYSGSVRATVEQLQGDLKKHAALDFNSIKWLDYPVSTTLLNAYALPRFLLEKLQSSVAF